MLVFGKFKFSKDFPLFKFPDIHKNLAEFQRNIHEYIGQIDAPAYQKYISAQDISIIKNIIRQGEWKNKESITRIQTQIHTILFSPPKKSEN